MNRLNNIIIILLLTINSLYSYDSKVSLQLQWKHQFEFAGFYMAKEKGFYKDSGLDVEIREYDFDTNITDDVCMKKATFGTNYPTTILDKFNGKNIVLLNAFLQVSPHVLVSLKSSGIKSIEDFKHKKIMIEDNAILTTTIKSMLKSHNISLDDMTQLNHTFDVNDLITGKVDIITAFTSNELHQLDILGIQYDVWNPKDYGFDFYDVILFTSTFEVQNNPIRVEAFRKASLKGWKYAFDNIEETIDLILKKYNTQNRTREALLYEAKELKKLAYYQKQELGKIDKNKIQRIYDMYNLMGLITNKIEFDNFIYKDMISLKDNTITSKEKDYLKYKQIITMCIDPDWMPFEEYDKNGNHVGISRDYFDLFSEKLNIPIKTIKTKNWAQTLEFARDRKCDIISLAMETPTRKQYMNFTSVYLSIPLVLATKENIHFVDNFSLLKDKKVGIVEGYALTEILRSKYPNLNIIDVKNTIDGLDKVTNNELFGFIGSIADIGYIFQTTHISNLKVMGKFNERWELGIAVRNDDLALLNIFNKLLSTISENKKQEILNKYIAIKYEKGIDYTLLWQTSIGFILALLILIYFLLQQRRLKNKIESLNKNLELKIEEEVLKNRQKDKVMFNQSKLASMGEMIGNIAHQWRQPLNRINLSLAVIGDIINESETCNKSDSIKLYDKQVIKNKIINSKKNLMYMSDTIEDFVSFFRPEKLMTKFNLFNTINKIRVLLGDRLNNIELIMDDNKNININSHENELLQVFLIIVNNALDNFEINDIKNRRIEILFNISNRTLTIDIKDNSGGIVKENHHKIFEPYFTTKFKKEGTGVGLYMAKMLIEDSMQGELNMSSKDDKTIFTIKLKIKG